MFIRNLSNRKLTFQDSAGTIYETEAYGDLEVSDSLWDDTIFRRALKLRIREIEIESVTTGPGGAPTNAPYVTTAGVAGLSAEVVLGTSVIMAGTLASRPSPSLSGRLYYVTDTPSRLTRDTGAAWVDLSHAATHYSGGLDPLIGSLDANARVGVRKNSGSVVSTRRNVNFLEGTGITLTVADDAANEESEVTIAVAGGSTPAASIMLTAAAAAPSG